MYDLSPRILSVPVTWLPPRQTCVHRCTRCSAFSVLTPHSPYSHTGSKHDDANYTSLYRLLSVPARVFGLGQLKYCAGVGVLVPGASLIVRGVGAPALSHSPRHFRRPCVWRWQAASHRGGHALPSWWVRAQQRRSSAATANAGLARGRGR